MTDTARCPTCGEPYHKSDDWDGCACAHDALVELLHQHVTDGAATVCPFLQRFYKADRGGGVFDYEAAAAAWRKAMNKPAPEPVDTSEHAPIWSDWHPLEVVGPARREEARTYRECRICGEREYRMTP